MKLELKNIFNKNYIVLILVIAIGAILRLWGSVNGSFAMTFDVGRDLLAARDIVTNLNIPLIGPTTGIHGVFYGPWWYYFLAVLSFLSKGNPYFIVVSMGVFGLIGVLIAYSIGKQYMNKQLAIALAIIVSFSSFFAGTSAQIWSPDLVPTLMLFLFYLFIRMDSDVSRRKIIILSLTIGLTYGSILESEVAYGVVFIVASLPALYLIYRDKIHFFAVFFGLLFIELPRIAFELRHQFIQTKSIMPYFSDTSAVVEPIVARVGKIAHLFWESWYSTLTYSPSLLNQLFSAVILALVIALIIRYYEELNKMQRRLMKFSLLTIILLFILFTLYPSTVWSYYLVGLPVLYLMIIMVGYAVLLNKSKLASVLVLLSFVLLSQNWVNVIGSLKDPYFKGNASVFRNQAAVIDFIHKDSQGEVFNYIAYTPPLIPYTYQYLFAWMGDSIYHAYPSEDTAELFYVIIENDGPKDIIAEWYKDREGDGAPVWRNAVAGDIIVERRIREIKK